MSDHKGAALIYPMLPDAETIIADKGYDRDAFRDALAGRGITPCIPPRTKRRSPATYCKTLYRQSRASTSYRPPPQERHGWPGQSPAMTESESFSAVTGSLKMLVTGAASP